MYVASGINRSGAISGVSVLEAVSTWLSSRPLILALLLSLLAHLTLIVLVPGFRPATLFAPVTLTVELMPSARIESEPPPQPEAREPASRPEKTPIVKPDKAREPTPSAEARDFGPAAPAAPAAAEVLTLRAEPDARPAPFTLPTTPEPRPEAVQPATNEPPALDPAVLAAYGQTLSRAIGQYQRYPILAQQRGWQGTAEVLLRLAPGNRIVNVSILRSSGYEVLDRQAMEMVKQAEPLPPAPEALRPEYLSVVVPIVFKLKN